MAERVVSIGFLTRTDLTLLGEGFKRHFPIEEDNRFSDLLARLDEIEGEPQSDAPDAAT